MGRSGSSSKRKSSKKKRDKISSKKKKTSRKESKKSRRDYDSVTSYSDDDSLNSEHTSSPASESIHRKRKSKNKKPRRDLSVSSYSDSSDFDSLSTYETGHNKRRKARKSKVGSKSKKKRTRKRFSSPDTDDDARKRKRSGRDGVGKPRKKSSKKKSRKYLSSSDSESCSTCPSSGSTADGKRKRSRVYLDEDNEKLRAKKKHKARSPSYSSLDRDGSHHRIGVGIDDGRLSPVNNPRRLKSVITVAYRPHDEVEDTWEKDSHKEEIVYDQDEYPSPKSFDSNEGVVKEISEETVEEGEALTNNINEGKEIEDLESILRQKALENLRKFRGGVQKGPKSSNLETNNESDENRSSDVKVLDVENKPTNQIISNAQDSEQVDEKPEMDQCPSSQADVAKHVPSSGTNLEAEATTEPASSVGPIMEEHSLEGENEAKDGSQFEKKTMTVMRGGELVQVSYKVYIPKKVPALARRQLKR